MNVDLFLWPMILPMVIPIIYCLRFRRNSLPEIGVILLVMIIIVIFYMPLTRGLVFTSNIVTKFFLFVLLPLLFLYLTWCLKNKSKNEKKVFDFDRFGISNKNVDKSLRLGLLFIPIMLLVTFIVKYMIGGTYDSNFSVGIVSFIESFTEEFFFRGVLFLFLLSKTNLKVAYVTSLASFILIHPQNFSSLFIISTIVQGLLTLEICRRTSNLVGAWVVHGTNRFFSIAIYPFLM